MLRKLYSDGDEREIKEHTKYPNWDAYDEVFQMNQLNADDQR